VTGALTATLNASVNPWGLDTTAYFEYGLTPGYGAATAPVNCLASFTNSSVGIPVSGLAPGAVYHFRVVATNSLGVAYGPDVVFSTPALYAAGDLNGYRIVSQSELELILANYWPTSPWLYLTNVAGLGGTNVTFALSNSTAGAYSVEMSTNLVDWDYLGPATPLYQFFDTNAPALPQRYYRLRWP
jgi:hypothetical protein